MHRRARSLSRRAGLVLFWAWIPCAFLFGASLLAAHWRPLPAPSGDDERLHQSLAALRRPADSQAWMAVHVLYAACRCSANVVQHLVRDARPPGIAERIVMVGSSPDVDELLSNASIEVVRVSPEELGRRFAIEAAPLLIVVDPHGSVRYRGGYTDRKQALAIRDVEIIERLRGEASVDPLPLFGCAVSERLRELIDPLDLLGRVSPTPPG